MSGDLARIGNEELDSPGELVLSCGLRVSRLKAQLDRIETYVANIDHTGSGHRWAAFTDDELAALWVDTDPSRGPLVLEIRAELERRQL